MILDGVMNVILVCGGYAAQQQLKKIDIASNNGISTMFMCCNDFPYSISLVCVCTFWLFVCIFILLVCLLYMFDGRLNNTNTN